MPTAPVPSAPEEPESWPNHIEAIDIQLRAAGASPDADAVSAAQQILQALAESPEDLAANAPHVQRLLDRLAETDDSQALAGMRDALAEASRSESLPSLNAKGWENLAEQLAVTFLPPSLADQQQRPPAALPADVLVQQVMPPIDEVTTMDGQRDEARSDPVQATLADIAATHDRAEGILARVRAAVDDESVNEPQPSNSVEPAAVEPVANVEGGGVGGGEPPPSRLAASEPEEPERPVQPAGPEQKTHPDEPYADLDPATRRIYLLWPEAAARGILEKNGFLGTPSNRPADEQLPADVTIIRDARTVAVVLFPGDNDDPKVQLAREEWRHAVYHAAKADEHIREIDPESRWESLTPWFEGGRSFRQELHDGERLYGYARNKFDSTMPLAEQILATEQLTRSICLFAPLQVSSSESEMTSDVTMVVPLGFVKRDASEDDSSHARRNLRGIIKEATDDLSNLCHEIPDLSETFNRARSVFPKSDSSRDTIAGRSPISGMPDVIRDAISKRVARLVQEQVRRNVKQSGDGIDPLVAASTLADCLRRAQTDEPLAWPATRKYNLPVVEVICEELARKPATLATLEQLRDLADVATYGRKPDMPKSEQAAHYRAIIGYKTYAEAKLDQRPATDPHWWGAMWNNVVEAINQPEFVPRSWFRARFEKNQAVDHAKRLRETVGGCKVPTSLPPNPENPNYPFFQPYGFADHPLNGQPGFVRNNAIGLLNSSIKFYRQLQSTGVGDPAEYRNAVTRLEACKAEVEQKIDPESFGAQALRSINDILRLKITPLGEPEERSPQSVPRTTPSSDATKTPRRKRG